MVFNMDVMDVMDVINDSLLTWYTMIGFRGAVL